MKRFFGIMQGDNIVLEGGEAKHLCQVLRMNVGDKIIACVNDDNDYYCTLTLVTRDRAVAKIDEVKKCVGTPKKDIALFQAMPKRDYFESIVTKSIELGVSKIQPFISKFTVNHDFKRDRMEQIVISACKQCERAILPKVCNVISFEEMLKNLVDYDIVIFANEHESTPFESINLKKYNKIAIIVGAEAGFCEEEVSKILENKNVLSISLGTRILRCDTACLAMMAIVNTLSGN